MFFILYAFIFFTTLWFCGDAIYYGDYLCAVLNGFAISCCVYFGKQHWDDYMFGTWFYSKPCNKYCASSHANYQPKRSWISSTFSYSNSSPSIKEIEKQETLKRNIELLDIVKEGTPLSVKVPPLEVEKVEKEEKVVTVSIPKASNSIINDDYMKIYNAIIDYLLTPTKTTNGKNSYRTEEEVKSILSYIHFIGISTDSVILYIDKKFNEMIVYNKINITSLIKAIKEVKPKQKISFVTAKSGTVLNYYLTTKANGE